jgi:hypothetical protein
MRFIRLGVRSRTFLAVFGWAVMIASIVLQRIYIQPLLTWLDYVLLFLVNFLAGVVILSAKRVLIGCIFATMLAMFLMFLILSMPAFLGWVRHVESAEYLYFGSIVMIFKAMFPSAFVACFLGAVFGGLVGEEVIG